MREIKFRQRIKLKNGEEFWHYWGFCNADGTTSLDVFRSAHLDYDSYQYTQLKDKNGKEIYAGDFVIIRQYPPTNNKPQQVFYAPEVAGFVMSKTGNPPSASIGGYRLEILGNIHENPELLRG